MGVMSSPFDLRADLFAETFRTVVNENEDPMTEEDIVDRYNDCTYTFAEACEFLVGLGIGYGYGGDCDDMLVNENAGYELRDCEPDEPDPVYGCMDSEANNYDTEATEDDGSCEYDADPDEPTPCADSNRQTTDTGECADDCNAGYSFNWYKKCVEDVDKPCSDYNRHGDTFFAGCGECLDGYVVHSTDASRCVSESESDLMTSLKDNWLIIGIVVVGLAAIAS